jgi:hypothetical protein
MIVSFSFDPAALVMNQVLADGIGGLAVLARLVDESPRLPSGHPERTRFPVPAPGAYHAGTGRAW